MLLLARSETAARPRLAIAFTPPSETAYAWHFRNVAPVGAEPRASTNTTGGPLYSENRHACERARPLDGPVNEKLACKDSERAGSRPFSCRFLPTRTRRPLGSMKAV
jgi:hypothetical protein